MRNFIFGAALFLSLMAFMPSADAIVTNTGTSTTTALGNGVTTTYTISFDFRDNSQLVVTEIETNVTPNLKNNIQLGSGAGKFTVSGGNPGTSVVMGTAPSATQYLIISRAIPLTQAIHFDPASAFPTTSLEGQLDSMEMQIQNLNASGALTAPTTTAPASNWFNSIGANGVFGYSQPSFSDISGAAIGSQLPTPTTTTLGGVTAFAPVASRWVNLLGASGGFGTSRPAFTDISGVAVGAQLPTPTTTTLGGVTALAPTASRWVNLLGASGGFGTSQPSFSDISGAAIGSQLPTPTTTTLGGVTAFAPVTSRWVNLLGASGGFGTSIPAFTDISGVAVGAQLPTPTTTTLGGVTAFAPVASRWVNLLGASGGFGTSQPSFSDISGNISVSQMNSGTGASATTFWRGDQTWQPVISSITSYCWSGHHASANANNYSTTSTTFTDLTNADSGISLIEDDNNNFGFVTGYGGPIGSQLKAGITFTPPVSGRYMATASAVINTNTIGAAQACCRITDGTNHRGQGCTYQPSQDYFPVSLHGVFNWTQTPINLRIQCAQNGSGTVFLTGGTAIIAGEYPIDWNICYIP